MSNVIQLKTNYKYNVLSRKYHDFMQYGAECTKVGDFYRASVFMKAAWEMKQELDSVQP